MVIMNANNNQTFVYKANQTNELNILKLLLTGDKISESLPDNQCHSCSI